MNERDMGILLENYERLYAQHEKAMTRWKNSCTKDYSAGLEAYTTIAGLVDNLKLFEKLMPPSLTARLSLQVRNLEKEAEGLRNLLVAERDGLVALVDRSLDS